MDGSDARDLRERGTLRRYGVAAAILVLLGIGFYLFVGFTVLPRRVERLLTGNLAEGIGCRVSAENVTFNPFTCALEIHGLAIDREDKPRFIRVRRLSGRLRLYSLLRKRLILTKIRIESPRARIVRTATGPRVTNGEGAPAGSNEMLGKSTAAGGSQPTGGATTGADGVAPGEPPVVNRFSGAKARRLREKIVEKSAEVDSVLPLFALRGVHAVDGRVEVFDARAGTAHVLEDVDLKVTRLTNLPREVNLDAPFELSSRLNGASLRLRGEVRLFGERTTCSARLDLRDAALPLLLPYGPPLAPLDLPSGRVNVAGGADFTWSPDEQPTLEFEGRVGLEDLRIARRSGEVLIDAPHSTVEFAPSSVFAREYHVRNVSLNDPALAMERLPAGDLDWMVVLAAAVAASGRVEEKTRRGATVDVDLLELQGGRLTLADRAVLGGFTWSLEDVRVQAGHHSGVSESRTDFTALARSVDGELLTYGTLDLRPLTLWGGFHGHGIDLVRYAPYYRMTLVPEIRRGTLGFAGRYRFEPVAEEGAMRFAGLSLTLDNLVLGAKGNPEPFLEVPELAMRDGTLDLNARRFDVGGVNARGGAVRLIRDAEGRWNLAGGPLRRASEAVAPSSGSAGAGREYKSKAPAEETGPTASGESNQPVEDSGESKSVKRAEAAVGLASTGPAQAGKGDRDPWRATVAEVAFCDYTVRASDWSLPKPADLVLDELECSVRGLSSVPGTPAAAELTSRLNEKGRLEMHGSVVAEPPSGDLQVNLDGLEMAVVEPYLRGRSGFEVKAGELSADGHLRFDEGSAEGPMARYRGELCLNDFASVDRVFGRRLVDWGSLSLADIDARFRPNRLTVGHASLDGVRTHVFIEPDGRINLPAVLAFSGEAGEAGMPPESEAQEVKVSPPPPDKTTRSDGEVEARTNTGTPTVSTGRDSGAILLPPPVPPRPPMEIRIRAAAAGTQPKVERPPFRFEKLTIHDGRVDFADRRFSPVFELSLDDVGGEALAFSNEPGKPTTLHLTGRLGRAPFEINGEADLSKPGGFSDLTLKLSNLYLPALSPYSARYLGYNLAKGDLNCDLHYKLKHRSVDGKNRLTIDGLVLGEEVQSEHAVDVPLETAVDALKDGDGRIEMELPVTGNIGDLKVDTGPIVSRVVGGVVADVLTAPFELIGSIFESDDE